MSIVDLSEEVTSPMETCFSECATALKATLEDGRKNATESGHLDLWERKLGHLHGLFPKACDEGWNHYQAMQMRWAVLHRDGDVSFATLYASANRDIRNWLLAFAICAGFSFQSSEIIDYMTSHLSQELAKLPTLPETPAFTTVMKQLIPDTNNLEKKKHTTLKQFSVDMVDQTLAFLDLVATSAIYDIVQTTLQVFIDYVGKDMLAEEDMVKIMKKQLFPRNYKKQRRDAYFTLDDFKVDVEREKLDPAPHKGLRRSRSQSPKRTSE